MLQNDAASAADPDVSLGFYPNYSVSISKTGFDHDLRYVCDYGELVPINQHVIDDETTDPTIGYDSLELPCHFFQQV